jgi:THAP domain
MPMCTNSGLKVKKGECDVTFHQFPKEKRDKKDWIIKIRRDEGPEFQVRLELGTYTVPRPLGYGCDCSRDRL